MKTISKSTKVLTGILLSAVALSSLAGPDSYMKKKPIRAKDKADLTIIYVNSYYPEPNSVKVTVRNNGKKKSESNILTVKVGRMVEQISVPALEPYHAFEPEVKFDKPLNKGAVIRAHVDSHNHVVESNENNNTKNHTY